MFTKKEWEGQNTKVSQVCEAKKEVKKEAWVLRSP